MDPPVDQLPPPPPRRRSGCFKSCIGVVIAGFLFVVLVIVGAWLACNHIIHAFTGANARDVQIAQVSPQQLQAAEAKMQMLRAAIRNQQEKSIEFTAADLNALIANDPGFRGARGRAYFAIADSIVCLDLSVPLSSIPSKLLNSRWFNGRVRFGVSYVDDEFSFNAKSVEANGHSVPRALFSSEFSRSFNRSFNASFHRQARGHRDDFWRHLKMISAQDDKLIVTTRGT
jgi:hypothetical protein